MRKRIFEIVERGVPGDTVSRAYDIFIVLVAFVSIIPIMFKEMNYWLNLVDVITVYILTFDYLLRWMTQDFRTGKKGWKAFARYPFTPMALIDLLAILPSLGVVPEGFKFLRVLRIFKVFRYSKNLAVITNVFVNEKRTLLSVLLFALAYIFISALVMFAYEPETFSNFFDALYWSTTALTTIGYGDMYPVTVVGKGISMISSIFGIAVIALPAGIITGSFVEEVRKRQSDTEAYYEKHIGSAKSVSTPSTRSGFLGYFKTHPRVLHYLKIMALGVVLNAALYLLTSTFGHLVWLDTAGTALVAFLLEPAAGLIVGYLNDLFLAIVTNNAGSLLYYSLSAVAALVYGVLFARGTKITAKRILLAILLLVPVNAFLSTGLTYLLSGGIPDVQSEYLIWEDLLAWGWPGPLALFVATAFEQALDSAAVFILFFAFTRVIKRSPQAAFPIEGSVALETSPSVNEEAGSFVLGVDVGGTTTKVGVFTIEGKLRARHVFSTPIIRDASAQDFLAAEYRHVLEGISVMPEQIRAIGLAVPGMIHGDISKALLPNVDIDLSLYQNFFAETFSGAPCSLINDANAALLGDVWQGAIAERHTENAVFVVLGTGLGAGLLSEGRVLTGAHNAAGEIGHLCVVPEYGRLCNCGQRGCLEQYASATGLVQTARERAMQQVGSENGEDPAYSPKERFPDAKAVFDAAAAGDSLAKEAVSEFVFYLALGLSHITRIADPELIIIGGGLAGSSEVFIEELRACYRRYALAQNQDIAIEIAKLGNDGGMYGAAYQACADRV